MNFLFLLILSSTYLFSNEIKISNNLKKESILHQSQIYVDTTRKLTIEDITKIENRFTNINTDIKRYGYSPNFDVWIKLKLKNIEKKRINTILEFESPLTTSIELYENNLLIKKDGLLNKQPNRKSVNPIFHINFDKLETKTIYIKTSSKITSLTLKLNLYENNTFYMAELKHQAVLSLFFGAMIILALYNLSIYFFTRDNSYLFYVGYIFTIVIHHLLFVGFANIYILDQEQMRLVVKTAAIFIALPVLFLALFSKSFLDIHKFKTLNFILNIFIILLPLSILFFMMTTSFAKYRNIIPILLMCYLFFITVYAYIKGQKQANLILLGWGIILFAGLLMYFSGAGIFNLDLYYSYIVESAFVSEALIFSMALANKIKRFQEEKELAQTKLIQEQKNIQERLTLLVSKKTKDLKKTLDEKELLLKELNHRVKNNMQTIISLIRLQNDEIEDEKTNNLLTTIQNRISAMSHLHELLYKKDNSTYINAFDYFDKIVSEIKDSYENDEIDIEFNIKSFLNPNTAVYCGLILNELITNSFKYAFDNKKGLIKIFLSNNKEEYTLKVSDNGKGYNKNIKTNSLGLLLVETLATKQLGAKIETNSENAVTVEIKWREKDEY